MTVLWQVSVRIRYRCSGSRTQPSKANAPTKWFTANPERYRPTMVNCTANRICHLYISTLQPSDERSTLVTLIVHVYSPLWLKIKSEQRLQDGPNNLFCIMSRSRYTQLQWKPAIGSSEHYEARGQDQTGDIRKLVIHTINYNATNYYDMTYWFSPAIDVTQPPLAAKLSE